MDQSSQDQNNVEVGRNYHKLESPAQLQELLGADLNRLSLLYFRAEWAEICRTADTLVKSLSVKWPEPIFLEIEAESLPEVSESFDVASVPCFIILRGHKLLSRIVGIELSQVTSTFERFAQASQAGNLNGRYEAISQTSQTPQPPPPKKIPAGFNPDEPEEEVYARCKALMKQSKVVLFMKGTPEVPRCGFSQQTVRILQDLGIEFTTFDILTDDNIRQGMKTLNSWPTFPQLFIKGELVGGLDVLKEMITRQGTEKTELEELLED